MYALLNFIIALFMWTLVGRAVLWLIAGGNVQGNFVYRFFTRMLTPVLVPTRALLPRFIPDAHVGWWAFALLVLLRVGLYVLAFTQGWLPTTANTATG